MPTLSSCEDKQTWIFVVFFNHNKELDWHPNLPIWQKRKRNQVLSKYKYTSSIHLVKNHHQNTHQNTSVVDYQHPWFIAMNTVKQWQNWIIGLIILFHCNEAISINESNMDIHQHFRLPLFFSTFILLLVQFKYFILLPCFHYTSCRQILRSYKRHNIIFQINKPVTVSMFMTTHWACCFSGNFMSRLSLQYHNGQ